MVSRSFEESGTCGGSYSYIPWVRFCNAKARMRRDLNQVNEHIAPYNIEKSAFLRQG